MNDQLHVLKARIAALEAGVSLAEMEIKHGKHDQSSHGRWAKGGKGKRGGGGNRHTMTYKKPGTPDGFHATGKQQDAVRGPHKDNKPKEGEWNSGGGQQRENMHDGGMSARDASFSKHSRRAVDRHRGTIHTLMEQAHRAKKADLPDDMKIQMEGIKQTSKLLDRQLRQIASGDGGSVSTEAVRRQLKKAQKTFDEGVRQEQRRKQDGRDYDSSDESVQIQRHMINKNTRDAVRQHLTTTANMMEYQKAGGKNAGKMAGLMETAKETSKLLDKQLRSFEKSSDELSGMGQFHRNMAKTDPERAKKEWAQIQALKEPWRP